MGGGGGGGGEGGREGGREGGGEGGREGEGGKGSGEKLRDAALNSTLFY